MRKYSDYSLYTINTNALNALFFPKIPILHKFLCKNH